MARLYTIGHSNRSLDGLMARLAEAGIAILVDVRARPASTRFPHFDEAVLRRACETAGINYHWAGRQLGGRRAVAPDSPHLALEAGLRGFADYMDTEPFRRAAAQLIGLAGRAPTALLCAEGDPLRCHRSLIADRLTLDGHEVVHLLGPGESRPHSLRPEARRESLALVYDRGASGELPLD